MKKHNFIPLVVPLMTLILATPGLAATQTAASASLSDVQAAVNAASAGDTVRIPSGTASWASSLTMSENINLIGAGTNLTHIVNTISGNGYLIEVALTTGSSFRISSIDFNCNWSSGGGGIRMKGENVDQGTFNRVYAARIDHCFFRECYYSGGVGAYPIFVGGRVWGVVDHCTFLNNDYGFEFFGCGWGGEYPSSGKGGNLDWDFIPADSLGGWNYHYLGSTNNMVIEDNNFTFSRNIGLLPIVVAANESTHYVFRHNDLSDHYGNWDQLLEMHGNNYHCCGYFQGVVCAEVYANRFDTTAGQGFLQRGGTAMVFSNAFVTAASALELNEDEITDGGYKTSDCIGAGTLTYPKMQQVTNSHYWANTFNGTIMTPRPWGGTVAGGTPLGSYFVEGRDYWTHAPNSTNVLKDYRPLVYPHPLVVAQDGGGNTNPPVIIGQPQSLSVPVGASVSFSVTATGDLLAYQWRLNSANIAGATATVYSKSNVQVSDSGNYTVVVTNTYGKITSSIATLNVTNAPPQITAQPQSVVQTAGQNVAFTVAAIGTPPLSYQWRFNGSNLAGANGITLGINSVTTNSSGNYTVVIANSQGTVTSSVATLTVLGDLVAAYGFEEGSGSTVTDSSGNGNNGTATSSAWSPNGKFGNGMSFSNSLVLVPASASLNMTSAITLEAWLYPDVNNTWQNVLVKGSPTNVLSYVLNAAEPPNLVPSFYGGFASGSVTSSVALAAHTWTHFCTTYDGSNVKLYMNGVLAGTRAVTGAIEISVEGLSIGGNPYSGHYFSGLIDELRIYNRALSASEVLTDMNTPVVDRAPSPATNLRRVLP